MDKDLPPPPLRIIRHLFFNEKGELQNVSEKEQLNKDFINRLKKEFTSQEQVIKHGIFKINENRKLMYVIRRVNSESLNGYLVSSLRGKYRDDLVTEAFWRIMGVLLFVLIISWIASRYIARYLTKPLTRLQNLVEDIAKRKWENPVTLNREDEIGKLGQSIDWMRQELKEQNEKQQAFLQEVSHELKTPVMVIKSYVESIKDGIFPQGNLDNSLDVIEEEVSQLERRVRSLLNLTKLDYFSTQRLNRTQFNLKELIEKKVDRFEWQRSELDWDLNLESVTINGDKEKIIVAIENLLENQIRYADTRIEISLEEKIKDNDVYAYICINNDGPQIKEKILDNIFKKFEKSDDGEFGLGLAIVKIIVNLHQGDIMVQNEEKGPVFEIWLKIE